MNKPEWMSLNPCEGCEKQTFARMESSFNVGGKCVCLVLAEYTQVVAGQKRLLEYLRDHEWYTKVVPQGKGQRIISKKVGISREFVEAMLEMLGGK